MPDALPATKFKLYTGGLEAIESEGRKRFKTVASSSIVDRQGDQFTLKALESMAATASTGMTIYLNHSYKVPEDVLGTTATAKLQQRGEVWDLDLGIDVLESNPRAIQTWEAIRSGTQLGCSVGALVKNAWREKDGTVTIDEVDLLEASIVGIPANPRSWVERAIKSLAENTTETDEGEEPSIVTGTLPINPYAHSITSATSSNAAFETTNVQLGTIQPPVLHSVEPDPLLSPEVASGKADEVVEQEAPADKPAAESVDSDNYAKVETPGLNPVEAKDAPKESDQEAHKSTPESVETDGADEDPAVKTSSIAVELVPTVSAEFGSLVDLLKKTTTELVESKKALGERDARITVLQLELGNANTQVAAAIAAVEKIAATPLGTRTSFAYQIKDFREKFAGVYSDDFLKLLTNGEPDA